MDNSAQCSTRLDLAIRIARENRAYLTGLYVITHPHYAPQGKVMDRKVQQVMELFQTRTAGTGIESEYLCADWAVTGDSMVEMLNYYAHPKDLVIIGQTVQSGDAPADLPERAVLGSGRPVLIVPNAGTFTSVGERVVVAWKAGRASARAVHDAMPFLSKAQEVFVVTVTSPGEQHMAETAENSAILTHLIRHGIQVREVNLEIGTIPVDNVLMNFAWEHGCDLLVMGVYARTVRGNLTVGPVARLFFEQMTLPVLMSS